jgi:succinate dehydrogenase / fumarate reductase cytochrome b subunit
MTTEYKPPLSPHLQIYRLPLTALISITHRATGCVLAIAAVLFVLLLAVAANGPESYQIVQLHLSTWYGKLFLVGFSFALYIHLCNGVRHLFWDIGWGFELKTTDLTNKLVIVGAIVLTAITWFFALAGG